MASLSGNKIKDTYQSLIKLTDNGNLTTGAKQVTDGFGNNSPLYISTTQIGIGVTPEATYDLHVYQNAKVGGNLTITGDLTVNGTTTTVDTDTLRVEDPLIEVARNNTSSDAVDIGIYGKYAPSGTTLYAGLFRDTGDDKFKLFKSLEEQPTTTVNTSGTGYAVATLVANFEGTLTGVIASTTTATTQSANDNSTKVATTAYVDTSAGNYLPLAGGTMSGNIAMGSNNISGGGTFTATTFSGQLDGTISSTTTATTQTAGDNSTKVATTAYVDSIVTAQDLDFAGDSGTGAVDLDSQTFTIAGTSNEIETSASGQTLTIGLPDDVTIGNDLTVTTDLDVGGLITVGTNNTILQNDKLIFKSTTGAAIGHNTAGTAIQFFTTNTTALDTLALTISGANATVSGNLSVSGTGSFTGQVTVPATPSASTDAASKGYVDSQVGANNELSEVLANGNTTGGTDISVSAGDDILFSDSSRAKFGDSGSDLQIYHDGNNSFIRDDGTGDFFFTSNGNGFYFQSETGENLATFLKDSTVKLYYDNAQKFQTTSSGIEVTGGATFSGNVTITTTGQGLKISTAAGQSHLQLTDSTNSKNAFVNYDNDVLKYFSDGPVEQLSISNTSATFAGDVIIPEYIKHSGDTDTSIRFTNNNIQFYTANNEVLELEDDGQVNVISAGTVTNPCLTIGDDVNTGIWRPASDTFAISTGGNERMRIDSSGNLGIGTTSPQSKLHISTSTTNAPIRLQNDNGSGSTANYVLQTDSSGLGNNGFGIYDVAQSAYRFVIDGSGDVGIGVTDPEKKLEVKSDTTYDGIMIDVLSNPEITLRDRGNSDTLIGTGRHGLDGFHIDTYSGNAFFIKGSNRYVGIGTTSPSTKLHISGGDSAIRITPTGSNDPRIDFTDSGGTVRFYSGYDVSSGNFVVTSDEGGFGSSNIMVMSDAGNVIIGNTSVDNPNSLSKVLEIEHGGSVGLILNDSRDNPIGLENRGAVFHLTHNTNSRLVVDGASGSVGIGTTSPSYKLQVNVTGNGETALAFMNSAVTADGNGSTNIRFVSANNNNWANASYSAYDHIWYGNGTERMRILGSNGHVGIGTTSPGAKLDIVGSSSGSITNLLRIQNPVNSAGTGHGASLILHSTSDSNRGVAIASSSATNYATNNNMLFYTSSSSTLYERMRIDSNGQVGLGTTSPDTKLNIGSGGVIRVDSDSTGANNFLEYYYSASYIQGLAAEGDRGLRMFSQTGDSSAKLTFYTEGSERMRINSSGNVGLGTTSLASITGDVAAITLGGANGSVSGGVMFQFNGNNAASHYYESSNFRYQNVGNYDHTFYTSNTTQRFQINTNGWSYFNNQGTGGGIEINGTSGKYLDIYSTASLSGFSTNASSFYFNTNVGIGETSPGYKLDVNGTGAFGTGTYRTYVHGSGAGSFVEFGTDADNDSLGVLGTFSSAMVFSTTQGLGFKWQYAGNDRMQLTTGGNLGIGTTSPPEKLEVAGNVAIRDTYKIFFNHNTNTNRYIGASSSNDLDIAADDDINYRSNFNRFFNGSTEFARLSGSGVSWLGGGSNGYVGIGTTSPTVPLAVHGQQKWYTTSADGNELRGFFNPGGASDGAELYLYRDDGATQGVALRGQGNSYFRVDSTSDKLINFYYGTSNVGQIVTGGTNVLYQSNSDYRLKENVVEMTGALDRVSQLKPSRYNFISHPGEQVDGFMAHELQEVVPQAVSGEKDEMNEDGTPKYQGVDHSQIVPLLVGAIKELKAEIETLKTQINK